MSKYSIGLGGPSSIELCMLDIRIWSFLGSCIQSTRLLSGYRGASRNGSLRPDAHDRSAVNPLGRSGDTGTRQSEHIGQLFNINPFILPIFNRFVSSFGCSSFRSPSFETRISRTTDFRRILVKMFQRRRLDFRVSFLCFMGTISSNFDLVNFH